MLLRAGYPWDALAAQRMFQVHAFGYQAEPDHMSTALLSRWTVVVSSARSCKNTSHIRVRDEDFAKYNGHLAQETVTMLKRTTDKPHS